MGVAGGSERGLLKLPATAAHRQQVSDQDVEWVRWVSKEVGEEDGWGLKGDVATIHHHQEMSEKAEGRRLVGEGVKGV